jgi:hypothetical protein
MDRFNAHNLNWQPNIIVLSSIAIGEFGIPYSDVVASVKVLAPNTWYLI